MGMWRFCVLCMIINCSFCCYAEVQDFNPYGVILPKVCFTGLINKTSKPLPRELEQVVCDLVNQMLLDEPTVKFICGSGSYCTVGGIASDDVSVLYKSEVDIDKEIALLITKMNDPDYVIEVTVLDFNYVPSVFASETVIEGEISMRLGIQVGAFLEETDTRIYSVVSEKKVSVSSNREVCLYHQKLMDRGYLYGIKSLCAGVLGVYLKHLCKYVLIAHSKPLC